MLRGPCYLALRSLLRGQQSPDGIVLLAEPGRSLTARDVEDVTGVPVVARVAVSPTVARTIDAGLLVARLHRLRDLASLRIYATRLLCPDAPDSPPAPLQAPLRHPLLASTRAAREPLSRSAQTCRFR